MAVGKKMDTYSNMATITITESAANTLTFKKLETGFSTFEKVAWVIHRIEYVAADNADTDGDTLCLALCSSNTRTSISDIGTFSDPTIVDIMKRFYRLKTAVGFMWDQYPTLVKDFTNLPGGGMILPPTPIYGALQGVGMTAAMTCLIRFFYTVKELQESDYWQLVESRRSITA